MKAQISDVAGKIRRLNDRLSSHGSNKCVKEVAGVMGPRTRLGVVLNRENRLFPVTEARHGAVIEMPMGHFPTRSLQRFLLDAEAMILTGDLHPTGHEVHHRLICTSVTELQLVGGGPESECQELVAQTDSERGHHAGDFPEGFDRGIDREGDDNHRLVPTARLGWRR